MNKIKRCIFAILLIFLVITIGFCLVKTVFNMLFPLPHTKIILNECERNEIDPYVVYAVIKAESNFVSDAQSNKSAYGLMQITKPTAEWIANQNEYESFDMKELTEPQMNIQMGCWYLKFLLNLYNGDLTLALCAYNAGQGNVNKWLSDTKYSSDGTQLMLIPFEETRKYVKRIEQYERIYRKLYPDLNKKNAILR